MDLFDRIRWRVELLVRKYAADASSGLQETASTYGVGADWPLSYDDLEPFYAEAEGVMQVSGAVVTAYRSRGTGRLWNALARRIDWLRPSIEEKGQMLESQFPDLKFLPGTGAKFAEIHMEETKGNTAFAVDEACLKRFLLSTDFVQREGNPEEVFKFVIYYDPWRSPCYNPFMIRNRSAADACSGTCCGNPGEVA
ncbi:MAG: hypothetical protein A3F68_04585 [Acidobacteria bacterium RIFCSPLOWO2_12_FULL_54_10]|nr:MAG: hypothetical protein A3F68_04585 [Acidobacteria bacterium RIFCSPLOWO2_12_FULL_54_10]